jgi:hypothetical protein
MHFLYVDESGDTGAKPGSSSHFILCGLLIHHAYWQQARLATLAMRQRLEDQFGFPKLAELHASEFLGRNDRHLSMARNQRMKCALHAVGFLRNRSDMIALRVIIDKRIASSDSYADAWKELLETARAKIETAEPNSCTSKGIIVICDDHRTAPRRFLLQSLGPEMLALIVDQPFGMDSRDSQFLQLADLLAYLTKQEFGPSIGFSDNHSRSVIKRGRALFERNPK